MRIAEPEPPVGVTAPRVFATTQWNVVRSAGEDDSEPSRQALETLCKTYWRPIYVYVRRKGYSPNEAEDLTQEFFAELIAKQHIRLADQNKGRFRSFLLAALHYFLAREWRRAHRQKRGGAYRFVSLDQENTEERHALEIEDGETPEKTFQRHWAFTILRGTMDALTGECAAAGKGSLLREVKHLLSGERDGAQYGAIAARLRTTENALRVAVHRLRHRYGELLRERIAQTVSSREEVEEELRFLMSTLMA